MKVLFVCRGNVGRSQIAEAIFKQLTAEKYPVESAGTEARGSEGKDLDGMILKDRVSSKYAIECLKEIGVDISDNLIKRLTPEMVESSDKIIVMAKPDAVPAFLKNSEKVIYWDVSDPDGLTLETHRLIRDEIQKLVEELVENGTLVGK